MFDTFMNEVGEQRSYTDMVVEVTQGFTAQPGSIMRDSYGTQVKQRIHAAQGSQEPYYLKLYNSMGATDAARTREIAVMQMAMTPSGIDALKRNVESAMTYVNSEPQPDGAQLPGPGSRNYSDALEPGSNEQDQLGMIKALLSIQSVFGSQQQNKQPNAPGQVFANVKAADVGDDVKQKFANEVRQNNSIANRVAEKSELGAVAFKPQFQNANRLIKDERYKFAGVQMGENDVANAEIQQLITKSLMARVDQKAALVSGEFQQNAYSGIVNVDRKRDVAAMSALGQLYPVTKPSYIEVPSTRFAKQAGTTFAGLSPTQKFQELLILQGFNKLDQVDTNTHLDAFLKATGLSRLAMEDLIHGLSRASGVGSTILFNTLDKLLEEDVRDGKQAAAYKSAKNNVSSYLVRRIGYNTVPNIFPTQLIFPLKQIPHNANEKLTEQQQKAITEFSTVKQRFANTGPDRFSKYIDVVRETTAEEHGVLDRYGLRNLTDEQLGNFKTLIRTVASKIDMDGRSVNYYPVKALFESLGMFSEQSTIPGSLKPSATMFMQPYESFGQDLQTAFKMVQPILQGNDTESRKKIGNALQLLSIPDKAFGRDAPGLEQFRSDEERKEAFEVGEGRTLLAMEGLDAKLGKLGISSHLSASEMLRTHQMFAPQGDLAPGHFEDEFNDGIRNGGLFDSSTKNELMNSLHRIFDNPNLSNVDKFRAAEMYDRADFGLRRYAMSNIINAQILTTRQREIQTNSSKETLGLATDELISSTAGFSHIVNQMKQFDPELNTKDLQHQMYGWTGENYVVPYKYSNRAQILQLKDTIKRNVDAFLQLDLPLQAQTTFEGLRIYGKDSALAMASQNSHPQQSRFATNISVLSHPFYGMHPEKRKVLTQNELTQDPYSKFLKQNVRSFFQ